LPTFYFNPSDKSKEFHKNLERMCSIQSIIGIVLLTLTIILFKEAKNGSHRNPASPRTATLGIWRSVKTALQDFNFLLLSSVAGLMMGIILTIKALVGQISFIYEYDMDQAAGFGMLFILGGIFGSFVMGIFI